MSPCTAGQPFPHAGYMDQLVGLRDQLKTGLSGAEQQEGMPTVGQLAAKIKELLASNSVETAPERKASRKVSAEEPVTARIRRKAETGADATCEPTAVVDNLSVVNEKKVAGLRC